VKTNTKGTPTSNSKILKSPKTPTTPMSSTKAQMSTFSSKKRKTMHGSGSDDDELVYVSPREVNELNYSPSYSRHESLTAMNCVQDDMPRQRRAASAKAANSIKQELDAYDSEESGCVSAADSDVSELTDEDADPEMGI
jgi:hypothetical protein